MACMSRGGSLQRLLIPACRPRHNHATRTRKNGCNLTIGKLFVFAKDDNLTELNGKFLDCSPHLLTLELVDVFRVGIFR
jgi:hypothetical protein